MKKSVSIIGGGSAALLLAAFLDPLKYDVTIYEKNKSMGRKFLVAGKGGFNLTHSEPIEQMIERYTSQIFLKKALLNFDNNDLRKWLGEIGVPTFIGSSKRVYPEEGIKPVEVLNAILSVLKRKGVEIKYEHTWSGWGNKGTLYFNSDTEVKSDYIIFALGGGSWKVTGSDGSWLEHFKPEGIEVLAFEPSNCAYSVDWTEEFIDKYEGSPLKNIAISCLDRTQKGEVVITRFGLEGNAIYALSPQIREERKKSKKASIFLDLKPTLSCDVVEERIKTSTQKNITESLRNDLKLSSVQIGLLKASVSKKVFLNSELLAKSIKKLEIEITGFALLDEAISTTGGLSLEEVDEYFQLKKKSNHYCIGEMLDWDAPTGGYLLQACFSMGVYLARHLNEKN